MIDGLAEGRNLVAFMWLGSLRMARADTRALTVICLRFRRPYAEIRFGVKSAST